MDCILFHVPHSSLKFPRRYWNICIKDKNYIKNVNLFLCDYLTDKLVPNNCHRLSFKYSRLFCDVEKFKDDSMEVMAEKGMGVIYTNDCDNVIAISNKKYRNSIIKLFYDKHHNKLDKRVTDILNKYNRCVIVDFHSFSDEMVKKLFNINDNPDICIGVHDFYTDKNLLDITISHFKRYGYHVEINKPYNGTIIPNKYFSKKDKRLSSIMIEINKRIYLNNRSDFYKLKECINDYYNLIKNI